MPSELRPLLIPTGIADLSQLAANADLLIDYPSYTLGKYVNVASASVAFASNPNLNNNIDQLATELDK